MSTTSTPRKRLISEVNDNELPIFDDPQDLINAVISTLQIPEEPTNVAAYFANDKNLATEVQAYAKIAGKDWTYYVKSLNVSIGRNTDNNPPPANQTNQGLIDIDLGPAKVVSRQHANIVYNLETRCWELIIKGRNGARMDGIKLSIGENNPHPLHSGAILDIGGTQMMFILPDSPPNISPKILTKCLLKYKEQSLKHSRKSSSSSNFNSNSSNQVKSFQIFDKAQLPQSPSSLSATSLQSNLDQDLSKEESKDIKPPYSYATMITQAILSNHDGVMSLSEIYNWISARYAYYKYSKTGWQNSIRHNLSLNKAFEKVPRRPNEPGKGMKWQISESYKKEFLNKFSNGSMSKNRRGSSVSRQLHLHLATHKNLPETQSYYQHDTNSIEQQLHHNQLKQIQQHQFKPQQNLLQQQSQQQQSQIHQHQQHAYPSIPSNPMQSNPLAYLTTANAYISQQQPPPPPQQTNYGFQAHGSQLMYGSTTGSNNNSSTSSNQIKTDLSSPIKQLSELSNVTPKLPKVSGNHLYNLPPPPPSATTGTGSGISSQPNASGGLHQHMSHSRSNSYQLPDSAHLTSYTNSSIQDDSSNNTGNNLNSTAPTSNDLALNFTSPKKITPLEAFTPERGSKSGGQNAVGKSGSNNGNSNNNGGGLNTNQSSPAFWNFVQFSTPSGQTPLRKNSDESNTQGSPTLNRKILANANANTNSNANLNNSINSSSTVNGAKEENDKASPLKTKISTEDSVKRENQ